MSTCKTLADWEAKYPEWFERSIGHDIPGPGWQGLIFGVFDYVDMIFYNRKMIQNYAAEGKEWAIERLKTEPMPIFHVEQIKEKFGQLRMYMSSNMPEVHGLQLGVLFMSQRICMFCGRPGKLYADGWYLTLCDECAAAQDRTYMEPEEFLRSRREKYKRKINERSNDNVTY